MRVDEIYVSNSKIFKNISEENLEKIESLRALENVSKGEVLTPVQLEGKIHLVVEGEIELYQLSLDGKRIIIDRCGPGEIFTNTSLSLASTFGSTEFAQALQDTTLCVISKSDFMNILKEIPQVAINLIQELSEKLKEADNRIRDLAVYNPTVRLLNELMRLAKRYGSQVDGKIILNTRFTHRELGEMIGVSRETVTRCLSALRCKGFIDFVDTNRIVIYQNKTKDPYFFLSLS